MYKVYKYYNYIEYHITYIGKIDTLTISYTVYIDIWI